LKIAKTTEEAARPSSQFALFSENNAKERVLRVKEDGCA